MSTPCPTCGHQVPSEDDLYATVPEHLARSDAPETSKDAAAAFPGRKTSHRIRILGAFYKVFPEGLIAEEAGDLAGVGDTSASRGCRVSELKQRGFLERLQEAEIRKTRSGMDAEVWHITPQGRRIYLGVQLEEIV